MPNKRTLSKTHAGLRNLLGELRGLIQQARQQAHRAVDLLQVQTCWEVGRNIVEFEQGGKVRAQYGAGLLARIAETLTAEFGSGFDASNLRYMRIFFQAFPIRDALRHELSWTHYRLLMRLDDPLARAWYANEAATQNWSTRQLERQIGTLYYERLLASKDRKSVLNEAQKFLEGVAETSRNFVRDRELTHENIGQMDMYVRLYDDQRRGPGDSPTVGIILCASKDETIVRYSVLQGNEKLFASKYKLVLPSEIELRDEMQREIEGFRQQQLLQKPEAPRKRSVPKSGVVRKRAK